MLISKKYFTNFLSCVLIKIDDDKQRWKVTKIPFFNKRDAELVF